MVRGILNLLQLHVMLSVLMTYSLGFIDVIVIELLKFLLGSKRVSTRQAFFTQPYLIANRWNGYQSHFSCCYCGASQRKHS